MNQRLRKVKQRIQKLPDPPCPECGPQIRYVEEFAGGFKLFKGFAACSRCDLQGSIYGEESAEGNESLSELVEDLRGDRSKPIQRIYISCMEPEPPPSIEELEPGDVLQGPDGQVYRTKEE